MLHEMFPYLKQEIGLPRRGIIDECAGYRENSVILMVGSMHRHCYFRVSSHDPSDLCLQ